MSVRPSGEKLSARSPTGSSSRTAAPLGFQVVRSMKRTVPDESPTASSRPSGLTRSAVISTSDGRMKRISAAFCCRSANRSLRVSTRFWSFTPATASSSE